MVLVGMFTVLGSLGSYFLGAAMTGALWRAFRSDVARNFDQKQRDFYQRIIKYRANVPPNPTQMTFSVDYYGEKIRSIADYRKWLRHQTKAKRDRIFAL